MYALLLGQLWKFLCGFHTQKLSQEELYSYIQQAFFDSRIGSKLATNLSEGKREKNFENASTSTASTKKHLKLVGELRPRENKNTKQEKEIDMEEDIIPATPPSPLIKFQKKIPNTSKLTEEEILQKMPKTNIIDLIESIDGTSYSQVTEEKSFLAHIDTLSKKIKLIESEGLKTGIVNPLQEKSESVTENLSNSNIVNTCSTVNDTKNTKKSIADYFQKISKTS